MRDKNKRDFLAFIAAMQGKNLLHLGHKGADCDALGSAFALSCILPGDIGFARSMKASAQSLAEWLGIKVLIDPDPATYDYVIIHDTCSLAVLGLPIPERYALFDHHEPGGHRYAEFHSELAAGAEWAWVRPLESTCSLMVDLFQTYAVKIDQRMAVALAAGIVTDTIWLRQANAHALRRLATVLEIADLHVEDVFAVTDSPKRRAARRPIILEAMRGTQEQVINGWSILVAETDSQDNGFVGHGCVETVGGEISVSSVF